MHITTGNTNNATALLRVQPPRAHYKLFDKGQLANKSRPHGNTTGQCTTFLFYTGHIPAYTCNVSKYTVVADTDFSCWGRVTMIEWAQGHVSLRTLDANDHHVQSTLPCPFQNLRPAWTVPSPRTVFRVTAIQLFAPVRSLDCMTTPPLPQY